MTADRRTVRVYHRPNGHCYAQIDAVVNGQAYSGEIRVPAEPEGTVFARHLGEALAEAMRLEAVRATGMHADSGDV